MSDRERRRSENEVAFRNANERVREVAESFRDVSESAEFVCECGRGDCVERIRLTLEEYERIRSEPTWFFLVKGHEDIDLEGVVSEADGYLVVEKLPDGPAGVAIREDPRS